MVKNYIELKKWENREMPINMRKLDFVITAMKDYIA